MPLRWQTCIAHFNLKYLNFRTYYECEFRCTCIWGYCLGTRIWKTGNKWEIWTFTLKAIICIIKFSTNSKIYFLATNYSPCLYVAAVHSGKHARNSEDFDKPGLCLVKVNSFNNFIIYLAIRIQRQPPSLPFQHSLAQPKKQWVIRQKICKSQIPLQAKYSVPKPGPCRLSCHSVHNCRC